MSAEQLVQDGHERDAAHRQQVGPRLYGPRVVRLHGTLGPSHRLRRRRGAHDKDLKTYGVQIYGKAFLKGEGGVGVSLSMLSPP